MTNESQRRLAEVGAVLIAAHRRLRTVERSAPKGQNDPSSRRKDTCEPKQGPQALALKRGDS